MQRITRIAVVGLLSMSVLGTSLPCMAQVKAAPIQTRIRSIAVFKSGLGFFVREGEAKLNNEGWATTDVVPNAGLGTFWVGSTKPGVTIERLIASSDDRTRTVPAPSIREVLALNVGRTIRLGEGEHVISGKLVSAPDAEMPKEQPVYPVVSGIYPNVRPEYAVIETSTGTVVLGMNYMPQRVEFDGPIKTDYTVKEQVKSFRFKVAGAKDSAPVTMAYLQKGITWSPAYMIEMLDDSKARITMQALLVDDAEDIDGASVNLAVGNASFLYADTITPLASAQSISDFVSRVTSTRASGTGIAYQQSMNRGDGGFGGGGFGGGRALDTQPDVERGGTTRPEFGYSSVGSMSGSSAEDLFLYNVKDVSLKRGERAYYAVFSAEAPFRHIYEWRVSDTSNVQPTGYQQNGQPQTPPNDVIWHKLRLTNKTPFPWTSAPGFIMSDGQPLSQDTLNYTSKGGDGDINIAIAADVQGRGSEVEKSRQQNALTVYNQNYNKIVTDGKLTIRSFKSEPITVFVKKSITGEAVTVGQAGKAVKRSEGPKAVNPKSEIAWTVQLQPGDERTLDYTYFTYVNY